MDTRGAGWKYPLFTEDGEMGHAWRFKSFGDDQKAAKYKWFGRYPEQMRQLIQG